MNAPVITTTKVELREIAERIRSRTAQALIENGRDLLKAKVALPHGKFIAWLKHDVQITPRSAQRAMQVGDYDWQGQQIEENTRRVLERLVGPLDWTRLAITEAQVQERDLPRIQKPTKARAIQARMEGGKVYLPKNAPWLDDLVSELLHFPAGVHDDQVDVLSLVGRMLDRLVAGREPVEPKEINLGGPTLDELLKLQPNLDGEPYERI